MEYQYLDWDSNFFGYKVAKINNSNFNEYRLIRLLESLKLKDVKLVYFSSMRNIDDLRVVLNKYNGNLVDNKITYLKKVRGEIKINKRIKVFKKNLPTNKMYSLAIQSGIYSRFNFDKKIGKNKYRELYRTWILNSVNHKIAQDVLVYEELGEVLGMVTLSGIDEVSNIGIIAVDLKQRGKGIGKELLKASEQWAYVNSFKKIEVVTQEANKTACRFYEKVGFSINKVDYYYHFWLNN